MRDDPNGGNRVESKLVLGLSIVAGILVILALPGPWWVESFIPDTPPVGPPVADYAFGPFGWTYTGPSYPYSPQHPVVTYTFNYTNDRQTGAVLLSGAAVASAGLVSGIGMLALAILSDSRSRLRKPAVILGFLAPFLLMAAVLGVMLVLPGAASRDYALGTATSGSPYYSSFWGSAPGPLYSHQLGQVRETWGAGLAWYTLVVAAALFLISGILLFRANAPATLQAPPVAPKQP